MTELETKPSGDVKRANYNKFARTARLVSVVLGEINFKISPELHRYERSEIKRSVHSKILDSFYSPEEGKCAAKVQWSVFVKHKKKNLISCKAEYVVIYDGVAGFDKDVSDIFIESVASVNSYAYFRGLFAHLDWAAEGRSPPLPVFRSNPRV